MEAKKDSKYLKLEKGNEIIEPLSERLTGRYSAEDIIDPNTGEILVKNEEYIDWEKADKVRKKVALKVKIRSVFTCKSKHGVCAKCYGMNMATAEKD